MSKVRFSDFSRRIMGAIATAVILATVGVSVVPSVAFATYSTGTGQSMPDRLMSDLQRDYGLNASQAAGWVGNFGQVGS